MLPYRISASRPTKARMAGFTMAEALIAMVILSFAALQISALASHFARSLKTSQTATQDSATKLVTFQRIVRADEMLMESQFYPHAETIILYNQPYTLLRERTVEQANCFYDVVGKSCR